MDAVISRKLTQEQFCTNYQRDVKIVRRDDREINRLNSFMLKLVLTLIISIGPVAGSNLWT